MVLYRKYRPQKLADLVGQEAITQSLLAQLSSGKISHGYLFYGPRGTGKTSAARILAKAVNCQKKPEPCNKCQSCTSIINGSHLDLIELDAASNRGIEEIRDLREKIKLSPVSGRFKVYIIDEAHMLTPEAFNALLKTLEEPPAHAIFILCTTEFDKLPATVVSRLARFNFARAKAGDLVRVLSNIAKTEGIKIDKEALEVIAKAADGSFRDAVSILDQVSVDGQLVTRQTVDAQIKTGEGAAVAKFIESLTYGDLKGAVGQIEDLVEKEADIWQFARETVLTLERMLFVKIGMGEEIESGIRELAGQLALEKIQTLMKLLMAAEGEAKLYPLGQIPLVLAACRWVESMEKYPMSNVKYPISDDGKGEGTGSTKGTKSTENKQSLPSNEVKELRIKNEEVRTENKVTKGTEETKGIEDDKDIEGIKGIEARWGEFLAKVKPKNAHVEALLRSTRPTSLSSDKLILEVFWRFHKEKLSEPKIISMLEETMSEVLGQNLRLELVLAERKSAAPAAVKSSDVAEIDEGDLERLAAEIFSK